LLEPVGGREPCEPRADHDDARLGRGGARGGREAAESSGSERKGAGVAKELAPRRPSFLEHLVDLDPARKRLMCDRCGVL
jgi:hypothetical protein